MLKATIIYLPGAAGNMLYKTLTLSEKTITGTSGRDLNEYEKKLTAEEKFNQYSSWDSQHWKKEELKHCLNFKLGLADFYYYEQCKLWLIDHWHPVEFYNQYITNILWGDKFYEKVILIQVTPDDHKEFLISNQNINESKMSFGENILSKRKIDEPHDSIKTVKHILASNRRIYKSIDKV